MRKHSVLSVAAAMMLAAFLNVSTMAAGILTPVGSPDQPIQIRDHHVRVVIDNGFARTEVSQTFFNPNAADLEAVYAFPVPASACLSEVTIFIGEQTIQGEVLTKDEAERIYGREKEKGNDAGLAQKKEYDTFEFRVTPVRAQDETRMTYVYYQALKLDTGVGRYVYPLEEGGTDEQAQQFWTKSEIVEGTFSAEVELKSACPIDEVRVPGYEAAAVVDTLDEGHYRVRLESQQAKLNRDLVFYYRLQDNLPGRVELISYRADESQPGTFMLVVTPGIDLHPLSDGADYLFVLDVSGSMQGKIRTLAAGVKQAIGKLSDKDRFRIVTFNSDAGELTSGWIVATGENVADVIRQLERLGASGSTNIYAGLDLGLRGLDGERATSVILVTDGVTNTGVVDPREFHKLLSQYDIRLFGFLMGNNANWPLMRMICETTGGFYACVSNADDVLGQVLLAKSKITHECLHDAELRIDGVKTFDVDNQLIGKVYRGQQLVLFGRYERGGTAQVTLRARLTGEDRTYATTFEFPDLDTDNPEIERLWAMSRIEEAQTMEQAGLLESEPARQLIEKLGVDYQLVTDYTSMVVLSDASFAEYGVERRNQQRTAIEQDAQTRRAAQPVRNNRVDEEQPMFNRPAPRIGGGTISPVGLLLLGAPLLIALRKGAMR